jgi:hypothetical protein
MQMVDCLASVIPAIKNKSKPTSGNFKLARDLLGGQEKLLKNGAVFWPDIQNIIDVIFWDDQYMNWRLRSDISKRKHVFILIYFFTG